MYDIKINVKKPKEMRLSCYQDWGYGDYYWQEQTLVFDVCSKNLDEALQILVHEMIEFALINKRKIPIEVIDAFDEKFRGTDPGSDKRAPYHKEHLFAEMVENYLNKS